jgi:phage FluMu gp28-like protein
MEKIEFALVVSSIRRSAVVRIGTRCKLDTSCSSAQDGRRHGTDAEAVSLDHRASIDLSLGIEKRVHSSPAAPDVARLARDHGEVGHLPVS